jgi:hypothetical protein
LPTATARAPQESKNKKPSHIAYYTRKGREGEKDFWIPCGAAWSHKDGKGFRIKLDAVPTGGTIELRINEPKANSELDRMWDDLPEGEAW